MKKDLYFVRLKVKNFDGTFFYSDVKVLQRREVDLDIINIFPNPTTGEVNIQLEATLKSGLHIAVVEGAGRRWTGKLIR